RASIPCETGFVPPQLRRMSTTKRRLQSQSPAPVTSACPGPANATPFAWKRASPRPPTTGIRERAAREPARTWRTTVGAPSRCVQGETGSPSAFHEAADRLAQLTKLLRSIPALDCIRDAMLDVVVEQQQSDPIESSLHGLDLGQDVDAVALALHHFLEASRLALDSEQSLLDVFFVGDVAWHQATIPLVGRGTNLGAVRTPRERGDALHGALMHTSDQGFAADLAERPVSTSRRCPYSASSISQRA